MFTVSLTAQSLCLYGMKPVITESYNFKTKPTFKEVDLLKRQFSLNNKVELDMIKINVTSK